MPVQKTEEQSFTPAQVATMMEMFKGLIAEMKKPTELEAREIAKQEAKAKEAGRQREIQAKQELEIIARRKADQAVCSHRHHNGRSAMVPVETSVNGAYLICQHCGAKNKPGPGPFDEPAMNFIYDANLFWTHLQLQGGTTF